MTNELILKEFDIDFLKLINLAFKKQDWGKKYNLFILDDIVINIEMTMFDFNRNCATFKIQIDYNTDEYSDNYYSWNNINYFLENFSIKDFNLHLLLKIKSTIRDIIENRTILKAKKIYIDELYYYDKIDKNDIIKKGFEKDYNNILLIEDMDLQEDCLENLKDKVLNIMNETYNNNIDEYCKENENITKSFIMMREKINLKLEKLKK